MRYYDEKNNRIVCTGKDSDPAFWERLWESRSDMRNDVMSTGNTYVSSITRRYVKPEDGPVLEGGCGPGKYVASLHNSGYSVTGVDYAEETVKCLNKNMPELDIKCADVRDLPFEDGTFAGYWSLGVIEHFQEGYNAALKEMKRVIRPGGYLFITFPYMSPIRRIKANTGCYDPWNGDNGTAEFYQFIMDQDEVIETLRGEGFTLVQKTPMDGIKGLKDEIGIWYRKYLQRLYDYEGGNVLVKGARKMLSNILSRFYAHIILLVFRKER